MQRTIAIRCFLILLIVTAPLAFAQQQPPQSAGKTCEAFVKEFYAWYLNADRTAGPHGVWPYELTLKANPPLLSKELIYGLNAVDAEAAKAQDPGLDFEPILNTQDGGGPGDPPYLVRDVKVTEGVCRADVYSQYGGKAEKIVIPELRAENGRWIFTNFHYPDDRYPQTNNLINLIKSYLKMSKQQP